MNWKALLTGPAALAALLTLGNAAKPPVVDDTAYLLFARHLSHHPLDPYGWELFWYREPEPAMQVLLPPVLPYWLALGIRVLGEETTLLKLWLFPVCWLLTRSAWVLFARFAPGWERPGTTLTALGPAVLPLVNFMLDVPAAALGLAAVAAFVRGVDAGSTGRVLLAGLLAGLAMQTKYTALTLPAVFAGYALTRRQVIPAVLATTVAAGVFAAWEGYLWACYRQSHFLEQLRQQPGGTLAERLDAKLALFRPLVAQLGGLAFAWTLLAMGSVAGPARRASEGGSSLARETVPLPGPTPTSLMRQARRLAVAGPVLLAGLYALGLVAVATVPGAETVLIRNARTGSVRLDLPSLVYLPAGYAVLAAVAVAAWRVGRSADGRFLAVWVLVELAGYFALTPFPACRRVVPTVLAAGFLVARVVGPTGARWPVGFAVACGMALLAVDAWDARVEPAGVDAAATLVGDPGPHAVWTQGHWGWQYAADRRGWRLVEPGRSRLAAGDYFVQPVEPDPVGFYRPYHGGAKVTLDPAAVEPVGGWVWQDRLAAQTVPNLYGGVYPVVGRDHPRLRVQVYRVTRDWTPATAGTP